MDPVNQVFSHQVAVALKLSKNFDDFYVITSDHGEVEFGREKFPIVTLDWNKVGKIRKIWSLYFQTLRALIFFQPTHVFYHMVDTHCSLVSPIFRIFQIPQILWYAHTSNSKPLIFSSFFVNRILTSTTASFPSKSKRMAQKVRAIGQGIDVGLFPQLWKTSNDIDSAVSVGRLDRSKGLMQILQVLGNERRIPEGFRIAFIGSPITEGSSEYVIESLRNAKHSYPHIEVALLGKIPRFELGTEIAKYDFFIHCLLYTS